MQVKKLNEEVLIADEQYIRLDRKFINTLVKKASENPRKRIRICIHKKDTEVLQEMFIVHTKDTYVRPHKHLTKNESFHLLEGEADVVLFDDKGKITEVVRMGDYRSGLVFYYKIDRPLYHCLVIKSDYIVFHETTTGPFEKSETLMASWSPEESDKEGFEKFLSNLRRGLQSKWVKE